ncbi:Pls/PosA family non-ribosomal peptide synthetase [Actinokineospora sp. NBRC 105648]|uniref:Pls/PosA family non-ribosomal peptide synthetase n=1 Tax=Actinokineospora sp. NBRC 105648 TaxID=3032206 RepID=UPI0024A14756|nr:Pls/PosA family non-ribosomal peptide synthetase [Actinokineospora sp. NBRC 105648]GLZ41335.1 peptide synthetase [Actinokineospora sp. NBRC 105648]
MIKPESVAVAQVRADDTGTVLVDPGASHRARWRPGERLEHLFSDRCAAAGDRLAVDAGPVRLTYAQLDARANQLARHLLRRGVRSGDRVGLLFDQAWRSYVAMLAVLKVNAAYVPLDVAFPADRIGYIAQDADVRLVLTQAHLAGGLPGLAASSVDTEPVDELSELPLSPGERGEPVDDLCYIVYTSGSTGRPKGVAVEHAGICNFVRVAGEVYGLDQDDRVYQGMTIAFDFSVEEIWVPWLVGATLVPRPSGTALVGHELWEFLHTNGITALCCVPTLLATVEDDLPDLRFLLVSGEACPQDLISRWHRPGRRFLNVYGPTEATVTATWTTLDPDRPVTIGLPLPTYSVVILDPERAHALPRGETGEIGIAGIGLARGYLNRDDLTGRAFIDDFLSLDNNPSGRIYRTGDLGRVGVDGNIHYLGRIDTQVKVRGYRIELTEIESVLLRVPGIAQAVVDTHRPDPDTVELVAFYTLREDADPLDHDELLGVLRERLPAYMVPAYLERLDLIPMTPSNKADRKNLPAPSGPRRAASAHHVAPETPAEQALAAELARVLGLDQVSVEGHFFDELAVDSLLMSRFCARVRRRDDLPALSMRQVYDHPTVRSLAAALPARVEQVQTVAVEQVEPVRGWRYLLCGAAQAAFFLAYLYFSALVLDIGIGWVVGASGVVATYLRAVAFGGVGFLVACTVPVILKWVLIGRWRATEFPLWGLAYFRFWVVRSLTRFNPIRLFVGSPLYVLYLRSLGAKVGPGVIVLSSNVPVCTDLLTIGAGSVVRKDTLLSCYRAHAGRVVTGPVTLGREVFVGELSTLDIDTELGDHAQLGHASCLPAGASVPAGQSWHGSPAEPATVDYRADISAPPSRWRRFVYCLTQLLNTAAIYLPLGLLVGDVVTELLRGAMPVDPGSPLFYAVQLGGVAVLYLGGLLAGLVLAFTVPRLLSAFLVPDAVYPLYGVRYSLQRTVTRLSNLRTYTQLFGDSSYIVHYLRLLGYDLGTIVQTGSNFGIDVKHDSPLLTTIGSGTMVSDGLSTVNADYSGTAFRVRRTELGPRNFLGNNIVYPPGGRTGDNVLLATKVMVPLDGEVRADTGLLGSPAFAIPRSVRRDASFDHLKTGAEFRRLLRAKNRHNTATVALFLLTRCVDLWAVVVINLIAASLYPRLGTLATAAGLLATYLFVVAFGVFVERAVTGFRALRPRFCSIYDPVFWRHERFWKLSAGRYLAVFNGTPFKVLIWRLLGVRMGPRVFDDGCGIPEKSLVAVGADAVLNASSVIQGHSLEDGTFKSDRVQVGAGVTLGVAAFAHYGVRVGDRAVLEADSFLMKGGEVDPGARWAGNPAVELTPGHAALAPADSPALEPAGSTEPAPPGPVPPEHRTTGSTAVDPAASPSSLSTLP